MESEAGLIWSVLFGAVGVGYFIYGKRQRMMVPFAVGVALIVFPYFISNVYLMVLAGVGLSAVPYFIRQ
jgi:hypothetical protein